MSDSFAGNQSIVHDAIPKWFAAASAITYLSGYIICLLHYSDMDMTITGLTTFKLQYIYVGAMFELVLLTSCAPIYYIYFFKNEYMRESLDQLIGSKETRIIRLISLDGSALHWLYAYSILYLILFEPPINQSKSVIFVTAILVAIPAYYLFYILIFNYPNKNIENNLMTFSSKIFLYKLFLRILVLLLIASDYYVFSGSGVLSKIYIALIVNLGFLYYIIAAIASLIVQRTIILKNFSSRKTLRIDYVLFVCLFSVVSYLFCLFTFAHSIFPLIPSAKGGGDYTAAPRVEILQQKRTSLRYVLIYRDSRSIFVAVDKAGDGPCQWRIHARRPKIFEINDRNWTKLSYVPATRLSSHCRP